MGLFDSHCWKNGEFSGTGFKRSVKVIQPKKYPKNFSIIFRARGPDFFSRGNSSGVKSGSVTLLDFVKLRFL